MLTFFGKLYIPYSDNGIFAQTHNICRKQSEQLFRKHILFSYSNNENNNDMNKLIVSNYYLIF